MVRLDDLRRMEAMGMGVAVCLEHGHARRRSFVRYRDPASGRLWAVDLKAREYAELWDDELDPSWQPLAGAPSAEAAPQSAGAAGPREAQVLPESPLALPLLSVR